MKMMLDETVNICPKILLCNKFPDVIDEDMIISFMKNDILILEHSIFKDIENIHPIMAVVINLDGYLFNLDNLRIDIFKKVKDVIKEIKTINNPHKNVFSVHKFRKIIDMFNKESLKYHHRQDCAKDEMISIIKTIVRPICDKSNCRSSLRLNFKPHLFEVLVKKSKNVGFKGYLKDLSLTGIGIEIPDDNFKECQSGSFLSLRIDFKVSFLKIDRAIVTRRDKKSNSIGVKIDITDKFEIDSTNIMILENIINTWITKAVESNLFNAEYFKRLSEK